MDSQLEKIKTDKDAFEYVSSKLLNQSVKSMYEGSCRYRSYVINTDLIQTNTEMMRSLRNETQITYEPLGRYFTVDLIDLNILENTARSIDFSLTYETNKCAAGWLIDDETYRQSWGEYEDFGLSDYHIGNRIWDDICNSTPNWSKSEYSRAMVKYMQRIHDEVDVEEWGFHFDNFDSFRFDHDGSFIDPETHPLENAAY